MTIIGASDLNVFPLNLGGNPFGWTADAQVSESILDAFVAGGGNFIDTSDLYAAWIPGNAGGESEAIIGDWITSRGNRSRVVVATKVGMLAPLNNLRAGTISQACDASIVRLKTDYIDLYYAHQDDPETPIIETAAAFDALVNSGKVRYIGLSNYTAERVREYLAVATEHGFAKPVALQPHFNLIHRAEYMGGLQQVAVEHNLGVMTYFSLAAGFLTGKYRSRADVTGSREGMVAGYATETGFAALTTLDEVAQAHNVDPGVVALAWLRYQAGVVAPIASASKPSQVADLLSSATLELTDDELATLNAVTPVA